MAALTSIKVGSGKHHLELLYDLLFTNSRLVNQGKGIMWVPEHIGIPDNERADKAANEAASREQVDINIK